MNYKKLNDEKDKAVDWVNTPEGAKAFADTVVCSAFSAYGSLRDADAQGTIEAIDRVESCGRLMSMIHPQAIFHACCEHAHGGTNACIRAMIECDEIVGKPTDADALKALSHACRLMGEVVERTKYCNYENVCKALDALPKALDDQRIYDEAFSTESDGSWIGFDPIDGTVTVKNGNENPEEEEG